MSIPTAYTEFTLIEYMHAVLGNTAAALGWTVADGQYDEAVIEAVLAYGVTDIALATDVRKLRCLARREAWRAAVAGLADEFDHVADGQQHDRSQVYDHAAQQLARAEADALAYDDAYRVTVGTVSMYDPYEPITGPKIAAQAAIAAAAEE